MATQLSKYFTLEDLTKTSYSGVDNTPDVQSLENLKRLALLLDLIYDNIGPFTVTSGYRSPALNAAIQGSHPASSTSYHMRGIAADMLPENDTPYNFFMKILGSSLFANIGELINEADEQGIVHVSLPTPEKTSVAMYLKNGSYFRYSEDEKNAMTASMASGDTQEIAPSDTQLVESDVYEESPGYSPMTLVAVAAAAFILIGVIMASRRAAA